MKTPEGDLTGDGWWDGDSLKTAAQLLQWIVSKGLQEGVIVIL